MNDVFENGPIRIVQTQREDSHTYTIILDNFSQLILTQDSFDALKELMVAFEVDHLQNELEILNKQEQLEFKIADSNG